MIVLTPDKLFGVGLVILLMGCGSSPTASSPAQTQRSPMNSTQMANAPSVQNQPPVQTLPITAQATMKGQVIQLEVARTPAQQAQGLMNRPALPDDRGMLFPFNPPRPVMFWMKNTPQPLDMIFMLNGEVKAIAANAQPCTADPCPTYGAGIRTAVNQVIELRAGRAAELGLRVGDRVEIRDLQEPRQS
ncbi:MAG TPA: DUF192 domain-containing protein [Trichocoleus sp.]|jgi:uncharacterized membrane protein (UPF0127 family)